MIRYCSLILATTTVTTALIGCAGGQRSASVGPGSTGLRATTVDNPGATAQAQPTVPPAVLPDGARLTFEQWDFHGQAGKKLSSEHYNLYTTGSKSWMRGYAMEFAEQALTRYRSVLADLPEPGKMLDIFLFARRTQWQDHTRDVMGEHADLYLNLGRGGYATRGMAVLYDIGFSDTFAIMSHEGWHQYTQVTFKDALPTWLEEGIASYMEGRQQTPGSPARFNPWANQQRLEMLRRASDRGDLIKIDKLVKSSPQHFLEKDSDKLLVYYAQVWALVHFLVHGEDGIHRDQLRRVLEDAAAGRMRATIRTSPNIANNATRRRFASSAFGPGVLMAYFTPDYAGHFEQAYREFITRILTDREYLSELIRLDAESSPGHRDSTDTNG